MSKIYEKVLRSEDFALIRMLPDYIKNKFYLGGGTGLALQIGHRYSYDFDFFSITEFNNDVIKKYLVQLGKFSLFQESKGTLEGVINKTRISFLYYNYPLLSPVIYFNNIRLASINDIAAMKISALSGRGSRKDFIDLYYLKDHFSWDKLLNFFKKKYKGTGYNIYHIIKSLAYFEQAEHEPMPRMILSCSWPEVVEYFKTIQKELADNYL